MRLPASRPFAENDDYLLWLGLLTRDTGLPASRRLEITNPVLALDFDLAVTLRLLRFDNEKDAANKKWWARFIGGDEAVEDDEPAPAAGPDVW